MFHNTKRKFVVVESCFEVIFCHGHVFTCSSGCFCAFGFVDDVICETFSVKRSQVLVSAITSFCCWLFHIYSISSCCGFLIVLAMLVVPL